MDFDLNPRLGDGSLTHVCQRLLCLRHDPSSDHLHCLGDEADLAGNVKCVVDLKSEISKSNKYIYFLFINNYSIANVQYWSEHIYRMSAIPELPGCRGQWRQGLSWWR